MATTTKIVPNKIFNGNRHNSEVGRLISVIDRQTENIKQPGEGLANEMKLMTCSVVD